MTDKTLTNTSMELANKAKVEVHGDPGRWICVCKASCPDEKWMKSTKVLEINAGCLVQVTTQQGNHIAEALTFVPGASWSDFK